MIENCGCGGARAQFGVRGDSLLRLGFKCVECSKVTSEIECEIRGCEEPGIAVCVECRRGLCAKHWANAGGKHPMCELDWKRLKNVVRTPRPEPERWWNR